MSKQSDIEQRIDRIYKGVRNNYRVILYSDVIGRPDEDGRREQVSRDDMWAISTEELDSLLALITEARIDENKLLRRKMEQSSLDVGMGAWEALHNRQQSLEAELTKQKEEM